jgi:hypothetical protein
LLSPVFWAQNGVDCINSMHVQAVHRDSLANTTLAFTQGSLELWLEVSAFGFVSSLIVDFQRADSAGTFLQSIEVFRKNGDCPQLEFIQGKYIPQDTSLILEFPSAFNEVYLIKIVRPTPRGSLITGNIIKNLSPALCWENTTQGTNGNCYIDYGLNGYYDPLW